MISQYYFPSIINTCIAQFFKFIFVFIKMFFKMDLIFKNYFWNLELLDWSCFKLKCLLRTNKRSIYKIGAKVHLKLVELVVSTKFSRSKLTKYLSKSPYLGSARIWFCQIWSIECGRPNVSRLELWIIESVK